jgi:hypothetical protein
MSKFRDFIQEPAVRLLVVPIFFLVFGRPFLLVPEGADPFVCFGGLFTGWLAFVVLLFFSARS